jgi:hypothetical protein
MATTYDKASLVMIPSGVKESKLYSVKPTDGSGDFTFSRGTDTATRVNASGLIEKERGNLLLQSNTFSNAAWVKPDVSVTSGQSGYDGSSDAWRLTNSASFGNLLQDYAISGVQTFSVYAKADAVNWMWIRIDTSGTQQGQYFDLANGVLGATGTNVDAKIEAVGATGWYRCSVTYNATSVRARIYPALADNGAGQLSGSIFIQDAQLEQGLVATDYIETTTAAVYEGITDNLPRLDYSGGASCPSLLLEPSRSNLVSLSEYIGGWSGTNMGVVNNDATSPEGVVNAAEIESTSTNASHYIGSPNFSMTSGVDYTGSMFVKAGTGRYFQLFFGGTPFTSVGYANFDLQEGIVTAEGSAVTGDIEPYANDWYRVSISGTSAATGTGTLYAAAITSGSAARIQAHNSVLSYNIWGAQCEAGSYPTSYIPCMGTSASRAADYSVRSDMQDYVGANEGTWFMHFKDLFFDITGTGQGCINLVHTSGNQIEFIQDGTFQYKITINNSVAVQDLDGEDKVAVAWSTSGLVIYINGVSRYTTTSSAYANPYDTFELTRVDRRPRVDMKQILFFKTRLTNEELATLTTI